jgi:hypothetical protein
MKDTKPLEVLKKLRAAHPRENEKKLRARFFKIVESDESLREALLRESVEMLCNDFDKGRPIPPRLRDLLVNVLDEPDEGSQIPEALRKPS